jgi:hypothetical protein
MFKSISVGLLSLSMPVLAAAGPFGIDLDNFSPQAYGCKATESTFVLNCPDVPKPHPDIETYFIKYMPEVGVCHIKGISIDISDSRYGYKVKSTVDEVYAQLKGKYGEAVLYDYLNAGSMWDQPEDWTIGISKGERQYGYEQDLKVPIDGVSVFGVYAKVSGQETGYWVTQFITTHADACKVAETKLKAGSF